MPDLIAIPGFAELQAITRGDSRIKIAVLDGRPDLERACFVGANLSRIKPFWQQTLEPIDPFYIEQQLKINALKDKKKALKKALKQSEKENADTAPAASQSTAGVTASNLMRSHGSFSTVFNALLEGTDAPLIEQYRQLSASKPQNLLQREISPSINYAAAIKELEAEIKALEDTIPKEVQERLGGVFHATGIFSMMFGQPGSPVEGVAPYCTAINIPLFETATTDESVSPLNMAHAFNLALKLGVNIIHCAACHPTTTGFSHEMIQKAVKQCQDNNILIVAPSGNNKGEWFCVPAVLPNVLAAGMMKDNGQPANYSNWGGQYQEQGILAPGENILAAQPGTDEPVRQEGTSLAAPLMTGLSALMMSVQLQRGEQPNAEAVRMAFLNSAIPCDPQEVAEPERCLAGKLNIPGAYQLLTGEPLIAIQPSITIHPEIDGVDNTVVPANNIAHLEFNSLANSGTVQPSNTTVATLSQPSEGITPSAASKLVYALGTIGYDFGSEARRDTFKQLMPAIEIDGIIIPPNPYDARQMVDYLSQNPSEAKALIWTLNQELNPIYALEPRQGFAADVYERLILMLAGQIELEDSDDFVERISIPAKTADKTVQLFSGQEVPVITLINTRGMYGWKINNLVEAALQIVAPQAPQADEIAMRKSLTSFLHRVYFDFQNLGQTSKDRVLNFSVTNAFQAASSFAEAISRGMQLDTIEVEKSPFCRLNSDCWDVILKFFDPENGSRAKKVYRFTVDVSDRIPVTMGEVRSWSIPK
ncbi:S8 family peptidase [Microcoleus asticus]|uniref:Thermophilic serine proteinase n=1 Tax=Microcoleus asticus IPMA8 TaxID=2563858 RepID=A0ABX2D5Q1_9CYAN|nr:PatA/PatG family cyanobactin maturation protease [Microcoleus asticus]NQE37977.1 Thermophilic serine proteinase [Microcoleus asticus IPMA8]